MNIILINKRVLKYSVVCVLLLLNLNVCGQGINNNWLMGYASWGGLPYGQTEMNFHSGLPVISYDSVEMDFRHTHANISDSAGNLLFYTNGYYIADATNDTMQNGGGLNPGAYANYVPDGFLIPQGALIIKKPGSNNIYYVFHSTDDNYPQPISYAYQLYKTEIDITLNNGKGSVISKNIPVLVDTLNCGKIAACKAADGVSWWVMVHRANSNMFYKLLVSSSGIFNYTQNIGTVRQWDAGQAWFSPDGNKYAYFYINGGLDIFDFDRCSGNLSNPIHISIPYENGYNVGMAFSPGSNALYISNVFHVYQYDLTATNIPASQIIVATYDSFLSVACGSCPAIPTVFGLAALAPDGKIYLTTGNSTVQMHTIDNPDIIGIGCNVNQHSVLLPAYYFNTLPNHPNYFLGCDSTSSCNCLTTSQEEPGKHNFKFFISPNPTSGNIKIVYLLPQNKSGVFEIFDINGATIFSYPLPPWSTLQNFSLPKLADGIYNCVITSGRERVSRKLAVVKESR